MTLPLKNIVFDKIKEQDSLTDRELSKSLAKDGFVIAEDRINKLLLDLEILGLISTTWLTKDTRRIEVVKQPQEDEEQDEVEAQNKQAMEKDYEASFPGADNS